MYPKKYVPKSLTKKDKSKQKKELEKFKKMYKKKKYYTREKVKSFKSKKSEHIKNAERIYKLDSIKPSKKLAEKTGCSLKGLQEIVKKGQGAYYSSGSRPNQTPHSWGIARLASAITGGKSSQIDFHILEKYCKSNSKALKLAKNSKYRNNIRKTQKINLKLK